MSQRPSEQNVATTSSVRPSSSASVYAAMAARTPSQTSGKVDGSPMPGISELDFGDGFFQRVQIDLHPKIPVDRQSGSVDCFIDWR
jgi:hypothetical protein